MVGQVEGQNKVYSGGCATPRSLRRLRCRSGVARRLRCRSVRAVRGAVRLHRRLSRYLRRRSLLACSGAASSWRPGRVVTVEPFLHQPPHELPQRHVWIDVGQEALEPLQAAPALIVDDRLELPAPGAQRAHPVRRRRQLRVDLGQQPHHLPAALAGRLLHQRPPRRPVQHRRRLPLRRLSRLRRSRRRAVLPGGAPELRARRAARRTIPVALLPVARQSG